MELNPDDLSFLTHDKSPKTLADLLRTDIRELVDGLLPREIVDHVQRAVVAIEAIDGIRDAGDPD